MKFKKAADQLYSKLEKGQDGYEIYYYRRRKVAPVLNDDGSVNWFNFITGGSWLRLLAIALFVIIVVGFIYEYSANLKQCASAMSEYNIAKLMNHTRDLGIHGLPNFTLDDLGGAKR